MIGVAAGMALLGRKPFCYSIGNFATLRCLEQIRNDVAYHGLNISVVSNGGGFSYGALGVSHHATEDVSVMLSIPEIVTLTPSTDAEVKKVTHFACRHKSTKYIRLDKSFVKEEISSLPLSSTNVFKQGSELIIFCYGGILEEAVKLSNMISDIEVGIVTVPIISSLTESELIQTIGKSKNIIVLEENSIYGGLGSLISTQLMKNNFHLNFYKLYGITRIFADVVGDQEYMRGYFNLDAESMLKDIKEFLI